MESMQRTTVAGIVLASCLVSVAIAESRKEYRFTVGPRANVSVDAQYAAISVKPGTTNQVLITAITKGDKVDVDSQQHGNRVEVASHLRPGADPQSGRVDYELLKLHDFWKWQCVVIARVHHDPRILLSD